MKKYIITYQTAEKAEKIVLKFLLDKSNRVSFISNSFFEESPHSQEIKLHCTEDDPKLKKLLIKLKKDLIKKVSETERLSQDAKYLLSDEVFDAMLGFVEDTTGEKIERKSRINVNLYQNEINVNHYFFKLSKNIKNIFKKEGLFIGRGGFSQRFPCMYNPDFYKDNKIFGNIASSGPIITLYLTPKEKEYFEKNGIIFGYPESK